MNVEVKQIKLESVYKDAYIDRYRRLGYSVASESESEEDGKTYCAINLQRDRDDPAYEKLAEIEAEVDELCRKARAASDAPDEQKKVPMILWMSPDAQKSLQLDNNCLTRNARTGQFSHDNYFHSVLHLLNIKTPVFDPRLDIFTPCHKQP